MALMPLRRLRCRLLMDPFGWRVKLAVALALFLLVLTLGKPSLSSVLWDMLMMRPRLCLINRRRILLREELLDRVVVARLFLTFFCCCILFVFLSIFRCLGEVSGIEVFVFSGEASLALAVVLPGSWGCLADVLRAWIGGGIITGEVRKTFFRAVRADGLVLSGCDGVSGDDTNIARSSTVALGWISLWGVDRSCNNHQSPPIRNR